MAHYKNTALKIFQGCIFITEEDAANLAVMRKVGLSSENSVFQTF